jgi:hypothetical protein
MKYLTNAFSLQMISDFPSKVEITEIGKEDFQNVVPCKFHNNSGCKGGCGYTSCGGWCEHPSQRKWAASYVGHADTAEVLGVPFNRGNVLLEKGDACYVAQLQGGRLPEGSKNLPEGFSFKYLKIEIL